MVEKDVKKVIWDINPAPEEHQSWFDLENIIYTLLIGGAVAFLAWLLVSNDFKSILKKKDVAFQQKPGDLDITVEKDVLLSRLEEAIKDKDYRTAVRYQYLIVLKHLNENDVSHWKDFKLSTDYIKEIKDKSVKKEFASLTKYFNYSWYGNYKVNDSFFEKASGLSDSILSLIHI